MRKYVVRVESEAAPGTHSYFPPVSLEFPEPLSFRELSRLQTILRDNTVDRIDLRLSHGRDRIPAPLLNKRPAHGIFFFKRLFHFF